MPYFDDSEAGSEFEEDIVDLFFPVDASPNFGNEIISCIAEKGYCTIAMPEASEEERDAAVSDAQQMPRHFRMKQEIEIAYMGFDSNTKLSMRKHDAPTVEPKDTLSRCDRYLTHVALALSGSPAEKLGFPCKSRTNAFVRTSYTDSLEESDLVPESLNVIVDQQDWKDDIFRYLNFAQTRTLSMLYMIENDGGDIWLYPKNSKNSVSVNIPVTPNKMVIFRHDLNDYSYQPVGASVALQSWIMRDKSELKQISAVNLKVDERVAVVNPGHPEPTGPPLHVKAVNLRMPGEVEGRDQWWAVFVSGMDGVSMWPESRWAVDGYYNPDGEQAALSGKSYTKHGGFTSTEQCFNFDNKFFGIEDAEAKLMMVPHRWVPEVGYACMAQAGHTKTTLQGSAIGTWVGDVGPDWGSMTSEWAGYHPEATGTQLATYTHPVIAASLLAYTFDFKGPISSYDTACSSSLVALNAAHKFMFAQDPPGQDHSQALVMGVNTLMGPQAFINCCAGGMLTHVGRCFSFNRAADGYQRGEGCGAVFLDSQITEEEKQNSVANICGSATNQDGRSASITAPNGPAQTALIKKSMDFAGLDVNLVSMAECHGTGTALGDPIEVGAMQAVMRKRDIPLITVTTKSHIGHLEAAAGITGTIKCIMMIRASCGPPNCHLNYLNTNIGVEGYPVLFDTELTDTGYSSGYCGVSSFGFGGTNSRCDVYSECRTGPRLKTHVPLPPPSFPRHVFDQDDQINFVGTTTAWSTAEPMDADEPGVRVYFMTLGQTCVESFRLMLGNDDQRLFYPGTHKANDTAQVLGPDSLCQDRYWTIDGRADNRPAGTVYQVTFEWTDGVKRVYWMPTDEPIEIVREIADHQYFCRGTFNEWNMQPMKPVRGMTNTVEITFAMGAHEEEEFQFIRDRDMHQVFYPGPGEVSMDRSVCGPDEMGHDKLGAKFVVHGKQFESFTVQFTLKDGKFTVMAESPLGVTTWSDELE